MNRKLSANEDEDDYLHMSFCPCLQYAYKVLYTPRAPPVGNVQIEKGGRGKEAVK